MWSQYDENLNENPFLRDIQKNHNDIIKKASEENWVICVPRTGVFHSEVSVDVILDHVLIQGTDDNYCTLTKKQAVLKNKHIYTDTIYHQGGTEILFEEIFYINKISKYTVWCIDQPLFIKYNYCDSHKSRTLEDLADCLDFLWTESLGHGLLNDIKVLVEKFINQHQDIGIESLQTVKEYVGELFSQCLQLGFKRDIIKEKSMNNKVFLENFKLSVEIYMQHCLGRNLIFSINTSQYQADGFLNKLIRNSTDLDLQDLDISVKFLDVVTVAKRELGKINSYNTVLDKINCLKKTFTNFYSICEDTQIQLTSDVILELMVYLILKLNVSNWMSNIVFIKEFRLSLMDNSDQCSFFVTNLEAAVEFIKSNHFIDIKNKICKDIASRSAVDLLSEKLSSGEVKLNMDFPLSTSNNSVANFCHPLCYCEKCQETIVSAGNDIEHRIFVGGHENLLTAAAKLGNCDVVEYLLKKKHYNVNATDCFNKTCLHYAAAKGYQDILLLSIICNANVNAVDKDKNTPLHLACMNGHENCVKALIYSTCEVELNIGNSFGETPLHFATKWGYLDIIKILLENGASMIIENNQKQTVISLASNHHILNLFQHFGSQHSKQLFKEFEANKIISKQEKNISVDHCKEHGIRPKDMEQYKKIDLLLKAIESNDFPLACFYLGFTSNCLRKLKKNACHPLCICEKCNSEQEFEVQSDSSQPFNINMCNVHGLTPLHIASKYGRADVMRLLLDSGALLNAKTYKTLYTPLHLACMNRRIQTVHELLKCGNCKVDECDAQGNTPLFYAVANNDLKIVEILLSNGADATRKNCADKSPLQESEDMMYYRVYRVLRNSLTSFLNKYSRSNSPDAMF